ncbi:MAG: PucR family transcriptional regulator ligand-binding domain-containing protein [bacterium]
MLTVGSLAEECGLTLAAGDEAADRDIRWVHISELEDPTRWLSGGELLLTTGIQLTTAAKQRRFVELLDANGLAGLGVGVGFGFKRLPKVIVDEAARRDLPLFEVPYEMPFIAITEHAFGRLVNEQYDVLQRAGQVHERLERLVIEGRGLEQVLGSIATAAGGAALVLDGGGRELARDGNGGGPSDEAIRQIAAELAGRQGSSQVAAFAPEAAELAGRALVVPVSGRSNASPLAWLVVISEPGDLGEFERLMARQAAMVVGLELMRERVVRETERRLAGDLLAEALSGRLDPEELIGRLRPFGIGEEAAVLVFDLAEPHAAEADAEARMAEIGVPALVATSGASGRPLLCAVVGGDGVEPTELAGRLREALLGAHGPVRAAASRRCPVGSLRRAFHEARCALEATSLSNGDAPDVASHDDLGAFTLLLALQDDDALRAYSDGLLDPIERTEGAYGGELLRSLEAFIENNGNWERAARTLYCHRHTLRYRIRKVEELTGRDLGRATDRIELWLALRARELVR